MGAPQRGGAPHSNRNPLNRKTVTHVGLEIGYSLFPQAASMVPCAVTVPSSESARTQLHTCMVQAPLGEQCSAAAHQPLTEVPTLSLSLPRTPALAGAEHLARKRLRAPGVTLGWISRLNEAIFQLSSWKAGPVAMREMSAQLSRGCGRSGGGAPRPVSCATADSTQTQ